MTETPSSHEAPRSLVILAFASVYFFWGGTFLAIRFAVQTIPPFLMAGIRHFTAGLILYAWTRFRGVPRPRRIHWRGAAIVGGLLLMCGNGGVSWAEQKVPSGIAALMVATIPLWMVLINWMHGDSKRPSLGVSLGIVLGFAGTALLVLPAGKTGGHIDLLSALELTIASMCWAAGSLYSRKAHLPDSPLLATAMEMISGGLLLLLFGTAIGEWPKFHWSLISLRSGLSLGYLIVFGSLVGFTAYIWILRVSTPAHVSTYAYVNPVVAVALGSALAGEALTLQTLLATTIIVAAVAIIIKFRTEQLPSGPRNVLALAEECPAIPEPESGLKS
ncbi:MAG: EamA family transporter [Acidobacteriia bacterium]|nr:EamA family transporter [Terriglobia bacterium]